MWLTISRRPRIIRPLLIFGFFICGPLTVSSFAADNGIGFVDIQKAVVNTKEWKTSFNKFKLDFKKEKTKINAREQKIKKMLGELNKQSFVLDPKLKKKKEEQLRKEKIAFERYVEDQGIPLFYSVPWLLSDISISIFILRRIRRLAMAITRVWIEKGCVSCGTSENT